MVYNVNQNKNKMVVGAVEISETNQPAVMGGVVCGDSEGALVSGNYTMAFGCDI